MIDKSEAQKAASKVYERLLAQGRPEPQARRDAEKWVKGNYGVDVTLPAPSTAPTVRCARCGKGQRKLFWIEGELSRQESLCLDCIRRAAEATERHARVAEETERQARVAEETERRARAAEETERLRRRYDEYKERRVQERLKRQQEYEQERQRRVAQQAPPSKQERQRRVAQKAPSSEPVTWVGAMIGGVFMAGVGVGVVFLIVWIISLFGH